MFMFGVRAAWTMDHHLGLLACFQGKFAHLEFVAHVTLCVTAPAMKPITDPRVWNKLSTDDSGQLSELSFNLTLLSILILLRYTEAWTRTTV